MGASPPFARAPRSRTQGKREVLDRGRIGRVAAPLLGRPARPHAWLPYQGLRQNAGHIGQSQFRNARTQLGVDRKSTRLNSSHQIISYAVFCLKKKKKNKTVYAAEIHSS